MLSFNDCRDVEKAQSFSDASHLLTHPNGGVFHSLSRVVFLLLVLIPVVIWSSLALSATEQDGSVDLISEVNQFPYQLVFSTRDNRQSPISLDGENLFIGDRYYAFLGVETKLAGNPVVSFYINGIKMRQDGAFPYDLNGGRKRKANSIDLNQLKLGSNIIVARVWGEVIAEAEFSLSDPLSNGSGEVETSAEVEELALVEESPTQLISTETDLATEIEEPTTAEEPQLESSQPVAEASPEADSPSADAIESEVLNDIGEINEGIYTSTTLKWAAPSIREDGSSLSSTDLAGFQLKYRSLGSSEYELITINDGSVKEYFFDKIAVGEYEFKISVFDSDRVYSDFSSIQLAISLEGISVIESSATAANTVVVDELSQTQDPTADEEPLVLSGGELNLTDGLMGDNDGNPVADIDPVLSDGDVVSEQHIDQPILFSMMLSWTPPTQRESGETIELYELSGYKITYRRLDGSNTQTVQISGGNTTEYLVPNISSGDYEIRVSALDENGLEGEAVTINQSI